MPTSLHNTGNYLLANKGKTFHVNCSREEGGRNNFNYKVLSKLMQTCICSEMIHATWGAYYNYCSSELCTKEDPKGTIRAFVQILLITVGGWRQTDSQGREVTWELVIFLTQAARAGSVHI